MNAHDDHALYLSRAATFQHFYAQGATLQEIGDAFGISRERVRQVLADNGRVMAVRSPIDPLRALPVIRRSQSCSAAAAALGVSPGAISRFLGEIGLRPAMRRLWRWRKTLPRRKYTNAVLLDDLARLAGRLGRVPTTEELYAATGVHVMNYHHRFGSWRAACALVGLIARPAGSPGHITPLGPSATCRRGHSLNDRGNVYLYLDKHGRTTRFCKACRIWRQQQRQTARANQNPAGGAA